VSCRRAVDGAESDRLGARLVNMALSARLRLADQETRACGLAGLGNPPPAAAAAAESGNGGFPDPDIRPNRESGT
jgi:hypothetical protein